MSQGLLTPPESKPVESATSATEASADALDDAAVPAPTAGTAMAAGIAAAGAGVMVGSLFDLLSAAILAGLAALVGAGVVAFSLSARRPATVQWLLVPIALVLGASAALLGSGSGGSLPALIQDALFSGGLAQPPVPFDPGWRFLVVTVLFLLGAGGAAVAVSWNRPNLGVAVAVPVVALGALGQPPDAGPGATIVGLLGIVGGLVVAYGVEVGRADEDAGLQPRRLLRGLAAMAALGVGLAVLASAASFLLPEARENEVIPPQRPPISPPQEDRELFTVQATRVLPWRLGVLDVYEEGAWKTPPFDVGRFVDPAADGTIAASPTSPSSTSPDDVTVTFRVTDLDGRTLPGLSVPQRVVADESVQYDPRTQALRLGRLAAEGVEYTVTAPPPPSGVAMVEAGPPPAELEDFLQVPPPPPEVASLLGEIGPRDSAFERLQAARQVWYDTVVAAGAGDPVDVPPERIDAILRGEGNSEASPYEIVAGEALLARWVGVPSRMGYGWFGGDKIDGGYSIRPKHGSAWLEVWFDGSGWVPIVGKPPRAKGSLSDAPKNDDPAVRPTQELALITYVPIKRQTVTLLFEVVRFWVARVVPALVVVLAVALFNPLLRRPLRRRRWKAWARRQGPQAEVLVAYAGLRDRAWDLNVGQPAQTPLEFADAVRPDDEHRELAWLVTRVVWGDLAETAGQPEVDAVRDMVASVTRRLVGAQPGVARLVAAGSRASLQQPFAIEADEETRRQVPRWLRRPRRRAAAMATAVLLLLGACGEAVDLTTPSTTEVLPDPLVPTSIDDVRLQREPSAETAFEEGGENSLVDHGRVYTVRVEDTIEASLQIAALRPGAADRFEDVREGLLRELGGGRFEPVRVGTDSVLSVETNEQRLLLWFAPSGDWYQLLVARRSFDRADEVFAAVLATQRGQTVASLDDLGRVTGIDPRRGIP